MRLYLPGTGDTMSRNDAQPSNSLAQPVPRGSDDWRSNVGAAAAREPRSSQFGCPSRRARPCRTPLLGCKPGNPPSADGNVGIENCGNLQSGDTTDPIDDARTRHRRHHGNPNRGGWHFPAIRWSRRKGDHDIPSTMRVVSSFVGAAVFLLSIAFASSANAQAQISSVCGVTGSATAPTTITYDPFSAAGLSEVTIPLVLRRNRGLVLGRTNEVSLVLVAPSGTPPLDITYRGFRVLYAEGATAGRPRSLDSRDNGAGAAGEIRYNFGNLFSSDVSAPLNLRVTVPPGSDLSAGEPIILDILYICSGELGIGSVTTPMRDTASVRINVNTVSALQAFYAGSALDFGEVGDLTTAAVLAAPDRYTTPSANSLRVRSSGPFEVRMRSQNDFRLTYPGGNLADPAQAIRYSARFLGQEITSNASFGTRTCARAGITGAAGTLPLRATLKEGGATKTPAPNYGDTISITFTPVVTASAATNCTAI